MLKQIGEWWRKLGRKRIGRVSSPTHSLRTVLNLEELEERTMPSSYTWNGAAGASCSAIRNWIDDSTGKQATVAITADDTLNFDGNKDKASARMDVGTIKNLNIVNGYSGTLTIRTGNQTGQLDVTASLKYDGADGAIIIGDQNVAVSVLTITGTFVWNHGQFSRLQVSLGKFAVGGQPAVACNTTIDGGDKTISAVTWVINEFGTVTWKGGNIKSSDLSGGFRNGGSANATFDIQCNATFDADFTNSVAAANTSTVLTKSAGNGTTVFKEGLTNKATFNIASGVIQVVGNLVQTKGSTTLAGGQLIAAHFSLGKGFLYGSGSIVGNVVNSGAVISPLLAGAPGNIVITGNYTQTADGQLLITISATGTTSTLAAQADANGKGGTANLAGTLSVLKSPDYKPTTATLQFLTATSAFVGDFDQKLLGLDWTVNGKDYEFKSAMTADKKAYQLAVVEAPKKNSGIGGEVFADKSGSGQSRPDTNIGMSGVTVQLWTADANGSPLLLYGSTTTDSSGIYSFYGQPSGSYVVKVLAPSSWYIDPMSPGNSYVNPSTGLS